jgi:hypothetical protein
MNTPGPAPPRAPWGKFPLSELTVLLALALAAAGLARLGSPRGSWAMLAALALGALAGLELAFREHFAGHRSHATVLAAALTAAATAALVAAGAPLAVAAAAMTALFLAALAALRRAFTQRQRR